MIKTAMILAAGYGSRLKPLTDTVPKALIEIRGEPMLKHVITRLTSIGIHKIVINTHYLHRKITDYLSTNEFLPEIITIYEENILGTGGAVKNVIHLLKGEGEILIHNVDVFSEIDFGLMYAFHQNNNNDITLAVNKRETTRSLLLDKEMKLSGRITTKGKELITGSLSGLIQYGFCGVQIISENVLDMFPDEKIFEIIPFYLSNSNKLKIAGHDIGDCFWRDAGKPEILSELQRAR